jgi:hypothetical protein
MDTQALSTHPLGLLHLWAVLAVRRIMAVVVEDLQAQVHLATHMVLAVAVVALILVLVLMALLARLAP